LPILFHFLLILNLFNFAFLKRRVFYSHFYHLSRRLTFGITLPDQDKNVSGREEENPGEHWDLSHWRGAKSDVKAFCQIRKPSHKIIIDFVCSKTSPTKLLCLVKDHNKVHHNKYPLQFQQYSWTCSVIFCIDRLLIIVALNKSRKIRMEKSSILMNCWIWINQKGVACCLRQRLKLLIYNSRKLPWPVRWFSSFIKSREFQVEKLS
jgi:hypothetical protein